MVIKEIIKRLTNIKTCDEMELKAMPNHIPLQLDVEALDNAIRLLKHTEWILVSERLPEEEKTVMASTKYCIYPEAKYTKENGWEWAYEAGADYWTELEDVTAWMPLPKPYKAESEDQNGYE